MRTRPGRGVRVVEVCMATGHSRRRFLKSAIAAPFVALSAGCGTIFYPERRGQPAGRLDWKVVLLDGIGLFFFFIPGVIAFAVDFSNGTIYLPPEEYGDSRPHGEGFSAVSLDRTDVSLTDVEQAISRETGRTIRLVPGEFHAQEMRSLDDFETLRAASARS